MKRSRKGRIKRDKLNGMKRGRNSRIKMNELNGRNRRSRLRGMG